MKKQPEASAKRNGRDACWHNVGRWGQQHPIKTSQEMPFSQDQNKTYVHAYEGTVQPEPALLKKRIDLITNRRFTPGINNQLKSFAVSQTPALQVCWCRVSVILVMVKLKVLNKKQMDLLILKMLNLPSRGLPRYKPTGVKFQAYELLKQSQEWLIHLTERFL